MRRSPLRRKTPLKQSWANAWAWQDRSRKPLPQVGRKAKRELSALKAFRRAVKARAEGRCEARVSPDCQITGSQAHHKCPADRDRGQHNPDRGLWVCAPCHTDWIHRYPEKAYEFGLLIRDDGGLSDE